MRVKTALAAGALALGLLCWNADAVQAQRGGRGGRGGGVHAGSVHTGGMHVGGVHGAPYYGRHYGSYPYYHDGHHDNFWWGLGLGSAFGYGLRGWGYPYGSAYYGYPYDYGYYAEPNAYSSAPAYSYYYDPGMTYLPPADVAAPSARLNLEVHVPRPDAQVWINGQPSTQTGRIRSFTVDQIYPDRPYQYEVRATWIQDGRPVTQTQTISARAGETAEVDFPAREAPALSQ
ncbi:MAG: TIGR03000 domain-containing protein [Gemmataceae bacterium]